MSEAIAKLLADMQVTLRERTGAVGRGWERDMAVFLGTSEGIVAGIDNEVQFGAATEVLGTLLGPDGLMPEDGDAVILNDPYLGSPHIQDFYLVSGVYAQGKAVFYLGAKAHLPDIGGNLEGGFNPQAQEIWAEGVRITPLRVCRNNRIDSCTLNTILINSRAADSLRLGIESFIAALETGKEIVRSYGASRLAEESQKALAITERSMRQLVKGWRDGEYRSACPVDVESLKPAGLEVEARLLIRGDKVEVDLSVNAAQLKAPFNSSRGQTLSSAVLPFLTLLEGDSAINGGIWKVIAVNTKKGTIVDPLPPAPTSFSPEHVGEEISKAVGDAMGQFLSKEQRSLLARKLPALLHWHPGMPVHV